MDDLLDPNRTQIPDFSLSLHALHIPGTMPSFISDHALPRLTKWQRDVPGRRLGD
jgi:hypothetical protein